MWARHFEVFLAIWLSLSWLIFRYPKDATWLISHDFIIAAVIASISLLNYKYRYIHLLNLIPAFWLMGTAFFSYSPVTYAPHQNAMVLGLLLLMFVVIPPYSSQPPQEWENYFKIKK